MKNFFNKKNNSRGAVLFFAVMLSMTLLIFSVGILNIASKEINFSTAGKESIDSFYAADSGIECALFLDKLGSNIFVEDNGGISQVSCFGGVARLVGSFPDFSFTLLRLGTDLNSCAKITVKKIPGPTITEIKTQIISKGYNLEGQNNCVQYSQRSVERVIEVNY